jgi:hypothetical protein
MRLGSIVMVLTLVLAAATADAAAPLQGSYGTNNGTMVVGRYSESWMAGTQGQIGNTIHAMSWSGGVLGAQWVTSCASIAAPPVVIAQDLDPFGNGTVEYQTVYQGGLFWLTGAAAWGNGDPFYSGTMDYYLVHTTFIMMGGMPIAWVSNVEFSGTFTGYENCIQITIANAANSGTGALPPNYPPYMLPTCALAPGLTGEWGQVQDVQMDILGCGSATENDSWSTIKALYH